MANKQFDREYIQNFEKILSRATEENTPYAGTIAFLQSKLDENALKNTEFAAQIFTFMANITNMVTQNAMTTAMTLTEKELKHNKELELLQAQINQINADITDKAYITNNIRPAELAKVSKDTEVGEAQRLGIVSDTANKTAQSIKDLLVKQGQIDLVAEQTESERKKNAVGGLIDKEVLKVSNDAALIASKKASEDKQNEVDGILDRQAALILKDGLLKDEQKLELQAKINILESELLNIGKDGLIKDEQKLEVEARTTLTVEQANSERKKNATNGLLDKQILSATNDVTIKANQANLITRQAEGFNDNLRVEEAKVLKDAVFGYAVGGTTVPEELSTALLTTIRNVSQTYPTV